mgnify:CR=1 FL=1
MGGRPNAMTERFPAYDLERKAGLSHLSFNG